MMMCMDFYEDNCITSSCMYLEDITIKNGTILLCASAVIIFECYISFERVNIFRVCVCTQIIIKEIQQRRKSTERHVLSYLKFFFYEITINWIKVIKYITNNFSGVFAIYLIYSPKTGGDAWLLTIVQEPNKVLIYFEIKKGCIFLTLS